MLLMCLGVVFAVFAAGVENGIFGSLIALIFGSIYVIFFGGFIYLGLGIYHNTRRTAEAMEAMARKSVGEG